MKKRSYTFNFNTFKFICIFTSIAVLFFNLLSSQILKSFDNKYYKFFDDDNLDYKIILIGNSRTIKLQNYTDKEILNLSYNELNFEMVSFFLDVLKKKKKL